MDLVDYTLNFCMTIYQMAENAKANKERCQRVAQRVKALQELVLTIKQRGSDQISPTVEKALTELCTALNSAKTLMTKFSQTKSVMSFLKSASHEEKFCQINEKLTDNFQVLSGALQIEQGNILHKVYETVAGRRQDKEYCSEQASPTAPMPAPIHMPPMPVSSPTAPMPAPVPMPPMLMSSPTAPMPAPSPMPPMLMSSPTAPMPAPIHMPPVYSSRAPGTMASAPLSTTIVSQPVFATMSPTVMGPRPIIRTTAPVGATIAPMTISTQNTSVVRTYVVNQPYFPYRN